MLKGTCHFYKNSCISNTKMPKFKTLKFKILTKMFITKKKKKTNQETWPKVGLIYENLKKFTSKKSTSNFFKKINFK